MQIAVGIDIGGTNTKWGLVTNKGDILKEGVISTKAYPKALQLVAAVAQNIQKALDELDNHSLIGIGIGAPNGNYFNGTVEFAPNLSWEGIVPLQQLFEAHFDVPIWVTNDANAAAMGEMQYGTAKGLRDFLVVTLGTGLGSGFVVDGKVAYGHDGFAGELGHTIIDIQGRQCGCGRKGCLETYVSATGLVRTVQQLLQENRFASTLEDNALLTAKKIGEAAHTGDELALAAFDLTAQKLGLALANAVAITSPKMIVLFGGLAQSGDLLLLPTRQYFEEFLLNIFKNKVQLVNSIIPAHYAAILGASALAWKA